MVPQLANYLAGQLKAAGWAESDIHVLPYESLNDKQTAEIRITRLLIGLCREWYGKQLEPIAGR